MTTAIMPEIRHIKPRKIESKSQNNTRNKAGYSAIVTDSTAEQMSAQIAALELIEWIDNNLDFDRVHFWQKDQLLKGLDQVVTALLACELEIAWTFHLSGSFEEVESQTRELRYQFPVAEEREEATGETWRRVLRTGRVRY